MPSGVLDSPLLLKWQEFGSHPGHGLCLSRSVGLGAAVQLFGSGFTMLICFKPVAQVDVGGN